MRKDKKGEGMYVLREGKHIQYDFFFIATL